MTDERSVLCDAVPPTTVQLAEKLLREAQEYDYRARWYRDLAAKVLNPGEGVRVEINYAQGIVRFVGPTLEAAGA